MARTSVEIRSLVDELEEPFRNAPSGAGDAVMGLRDRMQRFDQYVFTRYDYKQSLSPLLTERISIGPALLRFFVQQAIAALSDDLKLHLEPVGGLKRQESAADKMEIAEAHDLLMLDPYGYIRDEMHAMQVRGFHFAGWLEMHDYVMPLQAPHESDKDYAERAKKARAAYYPFTLRSKPQETVAYAEEARQVTMAVCRYKLPLVDLMERYGSTYDVSRDDPDQMARVFNEHFGHLRAGEAQSDMYGRDFWRKEIEICVVDDGVNICHYSDAANTDDRYKGLGETEYPNPFGRPSLFVAEGIYNPGQPVAYRREPLLTSLILLEDQRALVKSYWASRSASLPHPYEHKIPPELMIAMANDPDNRAWQPMTSGLILDKEGRPIIQKAGGEMTTLENQMDPLIEKLFGVFSDEARIANPGGLLSQEDTNVLASAPATTVLAQRDERKRMLAGAQHSETNYWAQVLDAIKTARKGLNVGRVKGEPASANDWPYAFTATGKESVLGKSVQRGAVVEITPQDLDEDFTRTIEPVDNRASTRTAMIDLSNRRRQGGSILYDDWLEMQGVENVSEFKQKYTEEQLYQAESTRQVMAVRMRVAQFLQVLNGTPVQETLASMPDASAMTGQQAAPTSGTMQMASPRGESAGPGAVSTTAVGG